MSVFEKAREQTASQVRLKLLTTLAENPEATQRDLARELGVSLGMMVSYMKSCAKKGLIRSKQVAPRRWAYFVTPKGFAEKSQMVSAYLHRSMAFFRDTRLQLEALFTHCQTQGFRNIAMVGEGDVAEIAILLCQPFKINLSSVSITTGSAEKLKAFDAVLITDIMDPQGTYDALKGLIADEKLLSIATLCITRNVEAISLKESGK